MGKRLVYAAQSNRDSSPLSIGELACAGAFSAVPATLVAGPAERVKVLFIPDLWMLLGNYTPRAV
jgi:solute carrier family 25 carnitine/acylcarnitine transporter 20/29